MIFKYQTGDTWGFIDHVSQAAHKEIDVRVLAQKYDRRPQGEAPDPAEYLDGEKLPEKVAMANKAFVMATDLPDEGENRHAENLLDPDALDMPAEVILLYLEDCKDYDVLVFVTNLKAYLLNDKGQTIERLN